MQMSMKLKPLTLFLILVILSFGSGAYAQPNEAKPKIKIAMAQINPTIGDMKGNFELIADAYQKAIAEGADILVTPEMSVMGYPPNDILDQHDVADQNEAVLEKLKELTKGQDTALVVGHVTKNPAETGRAIQNSLSVIKDGEVVYSQAKQLLPTYDVFDEYRYFEPGKRKDMKLVDIKGCKLGFGICEDLWARDPVEGRLIYDQQKNPVTQLKKLQPDMVISLSASPYYQGKAPHRKAVHAQVAKEIGAPMVYVNQFGATDEILFDGRSFATDKDGNIIGELPMFKKAIGTVEFEEGEIKNLTSDQGILSSSEASNEMEALLQGLISGIQEYWRKTGHKKAVVGSSGGIDSALVLALAQLALGKDNVVSVGLPSEYSSEGSVTDAQDLAEKNGFEYKIIPIKKSFDAQKEALSGIMPGGATLDPLTRQNMQSRIRGNLLMAISGANSAMGPDNRMLLLTTGNKSEIAVGYCTIYGDMNGALNPIGDLYKMSVYALSKYINQTRGLLIPQSIIDKEPSAELEPGQKDSDNLPPYPLLDSFLEDFFENKLTFNELLKKHGPKIGEQEVHRLVRLIRIAEFKRNQAPPILKVTKKAFGNGTGRRVPITNKFQ